MNRIFPILLTVFGLVAPCGAQTAFPSAVEPGLNPKLVKHCQPGAWGNLEYYEIILEPPTDSLWSSLLSEVSVWPFADSTKEEALEELKNAGFSPDMITEASENGIWSNQGRGMAFTPSDKFIENSNSKQRIALLELFTKADPNFPNRVLMNVEGADLSIISHGIAPETLKVLESVTFMKNGTLSFFDRPYLLRKMPTLETKQNLIRAISRTKGLVVRLSVDPTSNLDGLADYWSAGGNNRSILPLLHGIRATSRVSKIDIVHLLPPTAKKYLNTFTRDSDMMPDDSPDCFWTCMNFFEKNPSNRVMDTLSLGHYINEDFKMAQPPLRFGDLCVIYERSNGAFVHSYVYIADDIVFTKNGMSSLRPYALTEASQMLSIYEPDSDRYLEVYRRIPDS